MRPLTIASSLLCLLGTVVARFDPNSKINIAIYWGQNSAGGQVTDGSDALALQQRLSHYCDDPRVDVVILAFLVAVNGANGNPELNFANQGGRCDQIKKPFVCPEIEKDITYCRGKDKTILLSLGGATTPEQGFTNKETASAGAQKVWEMFGPYNSTKTVVRPFGKESVDGFDLDFEKDADNIFAFATDLRAILDTENKAHPDQKVYLSAAPGCVYPEVNPPGMKDILNVVQLDMAFVQFYNSASCGSPSFNFDTWNKWATEHGTKFLVGLPANVKAATQGYVPPAQLEGIFKTAKDKDRMAGAMLWDASQAWLNGNYHQSVKDALVEA